MSRLEKVKSQFSWGLSNLQRGSMNLDDNDVDYLFQHIEELQAKVDGLEKDIENYKKACSSWEVIERYSRNDAQRYKQALEFYADKEGTYCTKVSDEWGSATAILQDRGEKARQALEQNQHG